MTQALSLADVLRHVAGLSREALSRLAPDTAAQLEREGMPAAPTSKLRPWAPYASKWEAEYAHRLAMLHASGAITGWAYETETLRAKGGTKYTPDFWVSFPDGREEYHEVKGHLRSRDAVRMRECAAVSPLPVLVVSKRRGAWAVVRTYPGRGGPER